MLIDWFTVMAQAVNFVILMWLLKRFLYRPILTAIDAREQRIAAELADADSKRAEAQKERDQFEKKNQEFEQQRIGLLNQATSAAKAERSRLLDQARQAAEAMRARQEEALRIEQQSLSEALSRRALEEVFAIARKALAELADATLEERMTEVFLGRLRGLDEASVARMKSTLQASSRPLLVRTAFILPPAQRAAIETVISDTLGAETPVQFATAPDLVSGIEISTNGQKLAWSIADYLTSLGKGVDELLKTQLKPAAKAEPTPDQIVNENGA